VVVKNLSKQSRHPPDSCTRVVIRWGTEHLDVDEAHVSTGTMGDNAHPQSGETGVHAEDGRHSEGLALSLIKRFEDLC